MKAGMKIIAMGCLVLFATGNAMAQTIRVGDAGTMQIEKLIEAAAVARAGERGVDIKVQHLKSDDIVKQAFLSNEIDLVFGSNAYRLIQKLGIPARHIFQLRMLAYFPVVAADRIKSWSDLDGKDFVVHARGSGTEVLAHQMAAAHGIKFSSVAFVPGSMVRANALLRGTIVATYVNIPAVQYIMKKAPGKFSVLPAGDASASDSAVFAKTEFIASRSKDLQVLIEELLKVIRGTNANPEFMVAEQKRLNLMSRLPQDQRAGIRSFYEVAVGNGLYPNSGGTPEAVQADFQFYTSSGDLTGDPASLKVNDYWDFTLLDAARKAVGN